MQKHIITVTLHTSWNDSFRYTWNFRRIRPHEYLFDDWLAKSEKKYN